jgi:hypothetical protein
MYPITIATSTILTFSSIQSDPIPNIPYYSQISITSRPNDSKEALEGRDSRSTEKEAGKVIWESATDYTEENNLSRSVQKFIEGHLQISGSLESMKKNSIFIDRAQHVVVKVFPKKDDSFHHFIREVSSNQFLSHLDLQNGKKIDFLGAGKCTVNGIDHLLILMQLASGIEIKRIIDQIFNSSDDKSLSIQKCKKVLSNLGKFIGEIHSKSALKLNSSEDSLKTTLDYTKQKIYKYLDAYQKKGGFEYEKIEHVLNQRIQNYSKDTLYLASSHGDAHLENYLYDEETDTITIIDTERMHLSIDSNNLPLTGEYIHDVARVEDDIAKWVLHHEANEALIQELIVAFHEGYDKEAGPLYIPSQFSLEQAFTLLTRLKSVVDWHEETNEENREIKKRIHDRYLSFFTDQ